ncbi:hypothetical protein [Halobaculum magnesiiphilum]|uniref:Uncharacterized protein n=1 Tax=Halobaculum magnesiiphilum TaxID=1017351 RepID=A0A8T8WCZ8_9EURY|nr:hypothetical protein [Halobaculum magnesiiphilum]QZP37633.1 hypothetical protein K6T50_00165 [Halobaculum magnesiiphilum]
MSESTEPGAADDGPAEEPYLAAAAADRWDVLRYEEGPEPVHRVVPAGAGSEVVTTYERRARSRRRLVLALVPVAAAGLPAAGWLLGGTLGIALGALLAAVTAAIIVRRHVAEDDDGMTDVPEVVDASADAATARAYGLENEATISDAEAYLDANPDAEPDRSPEDALEAAQGR